MQDLERETKLLPKHLAILAPIGTNTWFPQSLCINVTANKSPFHFTENFEIKKKTKNDTDPQQWIGSVCVCVLFHMNTGLNWSSVFT